MSVPPDPYPVYFPTLDQVGALLHARTVTEPGDELGTFTSETRPTDIEVYNLMMLAQADISPCIGDGLLIPVWAVPPVQQFLAMRTAMLVELAYWPEQTNDDDSIYQRLKELSDPMIAMICGWMSSVGGNPSDGAVLPDGSVSGGPQFTFPGYDWVWVSNDPQDARYTCPWIMGNDGSPLWGVTFDDLENILQWDRR